MLFEYWIWILFGFIQ